MKYYILFLLSQINFRGNNKYILGLVIIDALLFLFLIISIFINKILFLVIFSLTILVSVLLIIKIIIILKNKKKKLTEILIKKEDIKIEEEVKTKKRRDKNRRKVKPKEEEIKIKEEVKIILENKKEYKVISKQEKKKRDIQLKKILQSQKDSRNNANFKTYTKKEEIQKVNKTIEEMSIMGTIIKDQIIEEKKTNPEKFISIQDALKTENKDDSLFIMGLLAQNLENQGITTAIEKEEILNDEDNNDSASTTLQFMINGMGTKKKYNLHFDLGEERNEQLLNDEKEQKDFNNKLKKN